MIRGETIKYSKIKARKRRAKKIELLEQIGASCAHEYTNTNKEEDAEQLNNYKEKLEELRKTPIELIGQGRNGMRTERNPPNIILA